MHFTSDINLGQIFVGVAVALVGFGVTKFSAALTRQLKQSNDDHRHIHYVAQVVDHHSHVLVRTPIGGTEIFRKVAAPASNGEFDDTIRGI